MWNLIKKYWLSAFFCGVIACLGIMTVVTGGRTIAAKTVYAIRSDIKMNGINKNILYNAIASFEVNYDDNIAMKGELIEPLGAFNKAIGKRIVVDAEDRYTVYKMDNGQLTHNYIGYNITEYANNYVRLSQALKEKNIPLLFVQAPFKTDKYNNMLPYGISDESNALADSFLHMIGQAECGYLDLREVIHSQGLALSDMFFITDHHWTSESGLWASSIISEEIANRFSLDIDISHLGGENYTYQKYSDFMLGSQGKRVGISYGGLDDITIIEPTYDSQYKLSIPVIALEKEGSYSDVMLFPKFFVRDYYDGDPGRVYTGDNYALMVIENKLAVNDTKILLVKDSFSKTVIPFLASTCSELHVIDKRTFAESSISEYATANDIDIVVVLYNPSTVVNEDFFDFEGEK